MSRILFLSFLFLIQLIILSLDESAGETVSEKPIKVYFDAGGRLFQYLQEDLKFADLVRDPKQAEVHILLNSLPVGGGGREYNITFVGLNGFLGINDTLSYSFPGNVTLDERNNQIVRLIKIGLARYVAETEYSKYIDIDFKGAVKKMEEEDKWDGWVFGIGVNGSVEIEEARKEYAYALDLDIDRVKKESKFNLDGGFTNDIGVYKTGDGESSTFRRERDLRLKYVLSVSEHLSAGVFAGGESSTYDNIKLAYEFAPAIEYNIFPYSEAIRKNFSFLYRIGYLRNNYYQETIFFKEEESLFRHSIGVSYRMIETWGEMYLYLSGSQFLHELNKNRVDLWTRFSYRLTGSLMFDVYADASYINNQIHLPQQGATLEEILLNQKSLSTNYEYEISFGFRYTFGSIYNNVVNTRF